MVFFDERFYADFGVSLAREGLVFALQHTSSEHGRGYCSDFLHDEGISYKMKT